jgi:short-subunit dehydrogenase
MSDPPVAGRPLALVTGASSGIGAALARELAGHGHDLVLTARSRAAMTALAGELAELGAAVEVVPADLSRPGAAAALIGEVQTRGRDIDVLVNNAGLGAAGRFDHIDPARIGEILQVNIVALTELTRLLLPGMVARRHGRILLVSSVGGFSPGPRMAAYFASKAYVLSLGEALGHELRGTGVTVTVLCPGATATNFFAVAGNAPSAAAQRLRPPMSAEEVARQGYRALAAGRRVVVTGAVNKLLALAGRFAPHRLSMPVADRMMAAIEPLP